MLFNGKCDFPSDNDDLCYFEGKMSVYTTVQKFGDDTFYLFIFFNVLMLTKSIIQ